MTSEDGTYSGLRNVVSMFASHIVQKFKSQKKKNSFHDESLQSGLDEICQQ